MNNEVRGNVAVLFNDMINSNLSNEDAPEKTHQIRESGLVKRSVQLVERVRTAGLPIFWIQVVRRADRADTAPTLTDAAPPAPGLNAPVMLAGSFEAQNIDELPVQPEDQVILKPRMDPFIGTQLDVWLRSREIRTIILGGYSTNGGVEAAIRTGSDLGYDMVLASDCTYNVDEEAHSFTLERIMPKFSRVRSNEQIFQMLDI